MKIAGISCNPSVDVFESSDGERHIVEICWWDDKNELVLVAKEYCFLHWSDTVKIRNGLSAALLRLDKRNGNASSVATEPSP